MNISFLNLSQNVAVEIIKFFRKQTCHFASILNFNVNRLQTINGFFFKYGRLCVLMFKYRQVINLTCIFNSENQSMTFCLAFYNSNAKTDQSESVVPLIRSV